MVKVKTIAAVSVGFGLVVTSIAAVAGPNSKSPFASNKKKAWETNVGTNPAPAPHMQMPSHQTPNYQPQQSGASYQSPSANYRQPRPQVQTQRQAQPNGYYPGKQPANAVPAWAQTSGQAPIANQAPFASQSMNAPTQYPQNYRSQIAGQQNYQPAGTQNYQPAGTQNYQPAGTQNYQPAGTQNYQGQNVQLRGLPNLHLRNGLALAIFRRNSAVMPKSVLPLLTAQARTQALKARLILMYAERLTP